MKTILSKIESSTQEFTILACGTHALIKGTKVLDIEEGIEQGVKCTDNLENHRFIIGEIYPFGKEQVVELN